MLTRQWDLAVSKPAVDDVIEKSTSGSTVIDMIFPLELSKTNAGGGSCRPRVRTVDIELVPDHHVVTFVFESELVAARITSRSRRPKAAGSSAKVASRSD